MPAAKFSAVCKDVLTKVLLEKQVTMSTYFPSSHDITRKWFVIDASGKTLGRLATEAASTLRRQEKSQIHAFYRHG